MSSSWNMIPMEVFYGRHEAESFRRGVPHILNGGSPSRGRVQQQLPIAQEVLSPFSGLEMRCRSYGRVQNLDHNPTFSMNTRVQSQHFSPCSQLPSCMMPSDMCSTSTKPAEELSYGATLQESAAFLPVEHTASNSMADDFQRQCMHSNQHDSQVGQNNSRKRKISRAHSSDMRLANHAEPAECVADLVNGEGVLLYVKPPNVVRLGGIAYDSAGALLLSEDGLFFRVSHSRGCGGGDSVDVHIMRNFVREVLYVEAVHPKRFLVMTMSNRIIQFRSFQSFLLKAFSHGYITAIFYFEQLSQLDSVLLSKLTQVFGTKFRRVASYDREALGRFHEEMLEAVRLQQFLKRLRHGKTTKTSPRDIPLVSASENQNTNSNSDAGMAPGIKTSCQHVNLWEESTAERESDRVVLPHKEDMLDSDITGNVYKTEPYKSETESGNCLMGGDLERGSERAVVMDVNSELRLLSIEGSLGRSARKYQSAEGSDLCSIDGSKNFSEDILEEGKPKTTLPTVLNECVPHKFSEARKEKPKVNNDAIEPVILEDDDNEAIDTDVDLIFDDGVRMPIEKARENLADCSFMNDDMVAFLMKHYIPKCSLPVDFPDRNNIFFGDSSVYLHMRSRSRKVKSEENTSTQWAKVFANRKGSIPDCLLQIIRAKLSILPIHHENHWILALLQIYKPEEDGVSARLLTIDSKIDDQRNKSILEMIAREAHQSIRLAIKAGFLINEGLNLKELRLVRCENLPCQDNGYDCGWFMMLFAEHFALNRSWMEMSDNDVRLMRFSECEAAAFRERVHGIRKEIGQYMEQYTRRSLNFDYGRRVKSNPNAFSGKLS